MAAVSSDTPLYNSRIFLSYLKLIRQRYSHVDVSQLLSHAGMKEYEIADFGHWFSQRQVDLFHEKLVQLTGSPTVAREAGRFAASSGALGFLREFLLGLIAPEHVFVAINRVAANFSRSSRCTSRVLAPRRIELTVTYLEGVREHPAQCENRIGYIEAVFLLFNRSFPTIDHEECVFKGGRVCRYLISWEPSPALRLERLQRLTFCSLVASAALTAAACTTPLLAVILLAALPLHLAVSFQAHNTERKELLSSLSSMRDSGERLLAQVQLNYDTALMVNEIGEVLSRKTKLDEILSSVNQLLLKRLSYGRGLILLADRRKMALVLRSSFGFSDEQLLGLEQLEHRIDRDVPMGVLVRCFLDQVPVLAKGLEEVEELALPYNFAFFAGAGVRSFICVPIICEGESLGVLAVDDPWREGDLLESDLNLVQGIAPVIGIAVRNAVRLENERHLAQDLRSSSEQMERRVEERTSELLQAQEELELLYDSVAHDLRTPLRVIYGYGDLLLDSYGDHLDQTAREYLRAMMHGGEQMEATLDRLLDYSAARMTEVNLQRVDLSAMAERLFANLRVTDNKREVIASVQPEVVVTGDEELLKTVMENLLGNAWKYTAGKEPSRISFGMERGVCYVSDNGAGFDMACADRLFMPFQRLHGDDTFAGHGLGLALVRRMLDRLGGKIWGDGKVGEGATFYFTVSADTIPLQLPSFREWE